MIPVAIGLMLAGAAMKHKANKDTQKDQRKAQQAFNDTQRRSRERMGKSVQSSKKKAGDAKQDEQKIAGEKGLARRAAAKRRGKTAQTTTQSNNDANPYAQVSQAQQQQFANSTATMDAPAQNQSDMGHLFNRNGQNISLEQRIAKDYAQNVYAAQQQGIAQDGANSWMSLGGQAASAAGSMIMPYAGAMTYGAEQAAAKSQAESDAFMGSFSVPQSDPYATMPSGYVAKPTSKYGF